MASIVKIDFLRAQCVAGDAFVTISNHIMKICFTKSTLNVTKGIWKELQSFFSPLVAEEMARFQPELFQSVHVNLDEESMLQRSQIFYHANHAAVKEGEKTRYESDGVEI